MSLYNVKTVIENGYPHYQITDTFTGKITSCDLNELNETLYEIAEEKEQFNIAM